MGFLLWQITRIRVSLYRIASIRLSLYNISLLMVILTTNDFIVIFPTPNISDRFLSISESSQNQKVLIPTPDCSYIKFLILICLPSDFFIPNGTHSDFPIQTKVRIAISLYLIVHSNFPYGRQFAQRFSLWQIALIRISLYNIVRNKDFPIKNSSYSVFLILVYSYSIFTYGKYHE